MLIAQITDTHVRRKGDLLHHMIHTGRELRRAVEAINALPVPPAFVVATGDLVDRGKNKEYRRLRRLLDELDAPCYLVPGNHDDADGLRAAFFDHPYLPPRGPICYVVEMRPVRMIALDTTRGRKPGGELDAARLSWLDARLREAPSVPTLIAMHHPPFDIGIGPVDAHAFRGRDELAAVIAAHPQVVRLISGHIHRACEVPFGGTIASSAPSTAHQLIIDRGESGGLTMRVEPPSFALHQWTGRALPTTIVRTADPGAAPALRVVS
ncbi:3',5'-cyclic adenosine monophosphate phosphodiesterase CpdA [Vulcanimicrobium alpinum]|uniref:3',5'-cyclic adenosine monophosphate phosphodiesterase CpdA n=1 Tax=Vulcanimicrobium alpinum TaxID=3016050 RepID=A0AAN1XY88_UNVUL|nr:phosphodiesterase [Vulcanimicrobium alpinum]BDE06548.1 3',5'-cyclic adenosine monophosphate phosphodiesterase CpdA [Vulcanimicrobium alpinum]